MWHHHRALMLPWLHMGGDRSTWAGCGRCVVGVCSLQRLRSRRQHESPRPVSEPLSQRREVPKGLRAFVWRLLLVLGTTLLCYFPMSRGLGGEFPILVKLISGVRWKPAALMAYIRLGMDHKGRATTWRFPNAPLVACYTHNRTRSA